MASTHDAADYRAVFRQMVERSATLALQEAATPEWRPEPDKQAQLLHSLANALRLPAAWPTTLPLLASVAPRMEQAGLREEWLAYVERGIECSDHSGDQRTAALLVLERGILLERMGRLVEAQACLLNAAARFAALVDARAEAKAHNRLAYVLRGRRLPAAAAAHVAIARELLPAGEPENLYCDLVLGLLAADRHDWAGAEVHLRRCEEGWRDAGDRRLYGMALVNLGGACIARGNYAAAGEHLQAAAALLAAIGDSANEALVHLNLGSIYLHLQQPEQAAAESLAAEATYRSLQDNQRLALIYSNLGLAYGALGRWNEAERSFDAAVERFAALEDFPNLIDTLVDLARLYKKQDNLPDARRCALRARTLLSKIDHDDVRSYQGGKIDELLAAVDAPRKVNDRSGQT
jgi:tetratricopeptide (TPR) repeat protein